MFHTLITLAYTIPGLYLFLRIWSLFIDRKHRTAYILIFAVLFSIYPVANTFDEQSPHIAVQILQSVSGYLLPFFLYVFLGVFLTDLIVLINYIFKIVKVERIKTRKFRNIYLAGILSLSVMIVGAGIINFNTIRVTNYNIDVNPGSSDLRTLRIAFVSDLHLEEKVPERFVLKFVNKVNALKPDVVLFGGDIVEGGRLGGTMENFELLMSEISAVYGVYGVMGNHEGYGRGNVESFLKKSGIIILKDSIAVIGNSFIIAGRNDSRVRDRKSAGELLKDIQAELPVILLDHRPTDFAEIAKTGADVVLSGHTHHGQMFPINLITRSVYELSYGHMKKGNTDFFVSSGLRLWGPPVRTTARSEILVVDAEMKK